MPEVFDNPIGIEAFDLAEAFRQDADAALAALATGGKVVLSREPTEEMVEAAFTELPPMTDGEGRLLDDAECREHVAAALRAALTTKEETL